MKDLLQPSKVQGCIRFSIVSARGRDALGVDDEEEKEVGGVADEDDWRQ